MGSIWRSSLPISRNFSITELLLLLGSNSLLRVLWFFKNLSKIWRAMPLQPCYMRIFKISKNQQPKRESKERGREKCKLKYMHTANLRKLIPWDQYNSKNHNHPIRVINQFYIRFIFKIFIIIIIGSNKCA